jgi:hypothetical protein
MSIGNAENRCMEAVPEISFQATALEVQVYTVD